MDNNAREFDLAVILSMTTGRLLCNWYDLCDLANYLLGYYAYELDMAYNQCLMADYILEQYPQLKNVDYALDLLKSREQIEEFIAKLKAKFGNSLTLNPMSNNKKI